MAEYPNVYSTNPAINVASTASELMPFGFIATHVRVENLSAVNVYINLKNNVATSASYIISTCVGHRVLDLDVRSAGLGITTTSTVSALVNVLAVG